VHVQPDLDRWLPDPTLRVSYRAESRVDPSRMWEAASSVRLSETALLGRLVRFRIPGTTPDTSFDELFRGPPFIVLSDPDGHALVSGLVGRIWTLRRDYPALGDPEEFRGWSERGTARVVLANWVEPAAGGGSVLRSESRVKAIGVQGRLGLTAVMPLVSASQHLVASEGLAAAIRRAER
jgi:hypothetical protein